MLSFFWEGGGGGILKVIYTDLNTKRAFKVENFPRITMEVIVKNILGIVIQKISQPFSVSTNIS